MDITINLNQSLYARGFNDNERIHHNAFSRAEKLIDAQVKDAEQFDDGYLTDNSTQDFVRYYNTISTCYIIIRRIMNLRKRMIL
jgi:hypothetical protein